MLSFTFSRRKLHKVLNDINFFLGTLLEMIRLPFVKVDVVFFVFSIYVMRSPEIG